MHLGMKPEPNVWGGGGKVWTLKVYIYKIKNCNILVIKRENLG